MHTVAAQQVYIKYKVVTWSANYNDGSSNGGARLRWNNEAGRLIWCMWESRQNFTSQPNSEFADNVEFTKPTYLTITSFHRRSPTQMGSNECIVEGNRYGDLHEASSNINFTPSAYPQGVWTNLPRGYIYKDGTTVYTDVQIKLPVTTPGAPAISDGSGSNNTFCINNPLTISASSFNSTGLTFTWEYADPTEDYSIPNPAKCFCNFKDPQRGCGHWVEPDPDETGGLPGRRYWEPGDDCDLPDYVTTHAWHTLGSPTPSNVYTFDPQLLFPNSIKNTTKLLFRVKAVSSEGVESLYSDIATFFFLPPPPKVDITKKIEVKACFGEENGSVVIPHDAIVSNYTTLRWLLRKGVQTQPCDPTTPGNSNCGDLVWSDGAKPADQDIVINSLAPGDYSLWVLNPGNEGGNCYTPVVVHIGVEDELKIPADQVVTANISCNGANDGKISVTATGGKAAAGYGFTLTSAQLSIPEQLIAGNTFTWDNLPAGDYTVTVKNRACSKTATIVRSLTQPPLITGQITLTQPDCNTPGNGAISITAAPVAARYQYRLYQNGTLLQSSATTTATSYVFADLHSGDYSIEIMNADFPACAGWKTTATLDAVPALTIQLTRRDSVSCYGGSDGHIAFSASGGTGQFRYELKNGNNITNSTTGDFTNLPAGTYNVKVYNRKVSCNDFAEINVDVFQRAPLTVSLVKTDITCNGAADGMVRAVAGGGSASYKYTWQQLKNGNWVGNSFWFSTDVKIDALDPGTYRVIVGDLKSDAGCTVTAQQITITEPTAIVLGAVNVTDAVCLADGAKLTTSASGGDGAYTFAWSADNGTTYTPFVSPLTIRQAGSYIVKVTDGKGCVSISNSPKSISMPPAALAVSATLSDYHGFNVSCKDAADGKITVTATGGNGGAYTGYQYKINNGAYQASNIFDKLTRGTYIISVKDGRGCEVSNSYTLTQPDLQLTVTKQDINCYGAAAGNMNAVITGGATPYQLTVNGSTVVVGQPLTNLPAGKYSLHATDANGCSQDATVNILYTYPQMKISTATATDVRCLGEKGLITLSANGGDNNYTFYISNNNWATAAPYTSGSPLAAGTYQVRVTDGKGCQAGYNTPLIITAPPSVIDFTAVLSDYNGYNISCVGGNNGYAQLTATGGNGGAYTGYTYAVDNGPFGTNSLITGIYAGTHQLKVQDNRGCVVSKPITLTESAKALSIALVNKQDVRCAATPGGSITVTGSGGAGQLQYSIDGGTNWQTDPTFGNLVAGDYQIRVKDLNNCSNVIDITVASLNPAITVDNITAKDIVCYGTTGTIAVQSHGGSGALTNQYSLNGNVWTNFTNTTALTAGVYVVRIADGIGCYSKESAPVTISSPAAALSATITTSDFNGRQISCYGLQDGAFSIAASGGNGATYTGYTYRINGSAYTNTSNYTNQSPGNYSISIKDNRGCIINKSVSLTQPAAPVSLAVANLAHLDCGGVPTGKFDLQASGGTSPYTYTITGNYSTNNKYDHLDAGTYHAQVKDVNGCAATVTATINALYPAIAATATVTPVNCFGETSGAIRVAATGGDGAYNYQWSNGSGNSQVADRIPAGAYSLRIVDGKGCFKDFNYTVTQPELLNMAATGAAVCDGLNDGSISATVTGGTSPYNYSLNNGAFTANAVFQHILPGRYNLLVKDAHGCMTQQDLTIEKANVKPDVDFLVASRKNAQDTLVIKEISLPAPDRVSWSFHPKAVVLGYLDGTPMVKFSEAGTYWIEMAATFENCTYALRKNVTIDNFDPTAGPSYTTPVKVIDTATLSPNPNTGAFKLNVKLNRKQQAIVTVFDMTGKVYAKKQYTPTMTIDDQFSLNNVIAGVYLLRIVTENESRDIRFIITR